LERAVELREIKKADPEERLKFLGEILNFRDLT